ERTAVLAEARLDMFRGAPLLDPYGVYQRLMDYWEATMQDDAYLIAAAGWAEASRLRELFPVKNKEGKTTWPEEHDFKVGKRRFKADLVPQTIMRTRLFPDAQAKIEAAEKESMGLAERLDQLVDEQGR